MNQQDRLMEITSNKKLQRILKITSKIKVHSDQLTLDSVRQITKGLMRPKSEIKPLKALEKDCIMQIFKTNKLHSSRGN